VEGLAALPPFCSVTVALEEFGHQLAWLRVRYASVNDAMPRSSLVEGETGQRVEQGLLQSDGRRAGVQDGLGPPRDRVVEGVQLTV
jgi:hypothetical protein